MKTIIAITLGMLLCGISFAQGGVEAGLAYGYPVGDARLTLGSNFVVELGYLFPVTDQLEIGGRAGYSIMIGDEVDFVNAIERAPDQNYLTMAVSGLYEMIERFWLGADIGWGFGANGFDQQDQQFGIPVANVDGFFYNPKLRYHFTERFGLEVGYRSILIGSYDASSVSAGVVFVLLN